MIEIDVVLIQRREPVMPSTRLLNHMAEEGLEEPVSSLSELESDKNNNSDSLGMH